jgi:hypothetical protein
MVGVAAVLAFAVAKIPVLRRAVGFASAMAVLFVVAWVVALLFAGSSSLQLTWLADYLGTLS